MQKILVIEDDKILSSSITDFLEDEGFVVETAVNIREAREKVTSDLMILDWRLPDGRGVDFLKDIRAREVTTPVIMLTSKSDLEDKVLGLELGANDYMTKPFEPKELLARINSQLRNRFSENKKKTLSFKNILIDEDQRSVLLNSRNINLTKLEFDLLFLLACKPSKAFSRDEILNKVWGFESFPTTRTVDMHIKQLRQKLGENYFKTVHGIGYKFIVS